jgi:hypothetical protein
MRARFAVPVVTAAALAAGIIGSGVAHAANVPAGSVAVTILNPAAATVTLGTNAVTIDATQNTSVSTIAPGIANNPGSGQDTGDNEVTGGISLAVTSNNLNGYAVTALGPAGGITSGSNPVVPDADLHLVDVTSVSSNSFQTASASLDPSTPITVMSSSKPSGSFQYNQFPSTAVAGQDSTLFGFYVQPNALLGGQQYTATVGFTFVPNP